MESKGPKTDPQRENLHSKRGHFESVWNSIKRERMFGQQFLPSLHYKTATFSTQREKASLALAKTRQITEEGKMLT